MKIIQTVVAVLALSALGSAWAQPIPEAMESAVGFRSFDLAAPQTGAFEVSFDATPLADNIDAFTGISAAAPREAGDVAAIVRFNEGGTIDVRNGGSFRADQNLAYSANKVLPRADGHRPEEQDLFGIRDARGRGGNPAREELRFQKPAVLREVPGQDRRRGIHQPGRPVQGTASGDGRFVEAGCAIT